MRSQALDVTGYSPSDAERADRDHGHGDRQDAGVLGGAGEQEPGYGQQGHTAADGRRARHDGEQQLAAQRPGEPQQAQQRAAGGGRRALPWSSDHPAGDRLAGFAGEYGNISFPWSRLMMRPVSLVQPRPWLTRMTVRSASTVSRASPI